MRMFIGPIYELIGNGLRVHFKALKSALIDESKVPKGQDEPLDGPIEEPKKTVLTEKIIQLLRENPKATYDDLMLGLGVSRSTIKRTMGNLAIHGHIVRVGGKRYGHWEIRK